jgi:hypothetical protein
VTCTGGRTIAAVHAEHIEHADGTPDRKVTVTRDCGHTYQWGAATTAPLPVIGDRAMGCVGEALPATFLPSPTGSTFFDPRVRTRRVDDDKVPRRRKAS